VSDVALTPAGRNQRSGKFGFTWDPTGDVTWDDTLENEVMSRCVEKRGQWLGDPDGTEGSRLYTLAQGTSPAALQSDVAAFVQEALQPMIDAGTITLDQVQVQAPGLGTAGRAIAQVFYTPSSTGVQESASVSL
jgi:phage gp46-like protein